MLELPRAPQLPRLGTTCSTAASACYPAPLYGFARSISQNARGLAMRRADSPATARRSSSPVTRTSAPPASAVAIQRSELSLTPRVRGCFGLGTTGIPSKTASAARIRSAGTLSFLDRTRRNSVRTTSPRISSCSERTVRRTSEQSPRVAKAATRTFVSRKIFNRSLGTHPRRSGNLAPPRTGESAFGLRRAGGRRAAGAAHLGRSRCGICRIASRDGRAADRARDQVGWSKLMSSCITM
jgi:hypothetical protein